MPNFTFLSNAAIKLVSDDAFQNYGKTGSPANRGGLARLGDLRPQDLFESKVTDNGMAECCLSGLWLLHNSLDRSHSISQNIHSPEGSYWHGIMHRMEGDFGNSKYWFRQVEPHPVFEQLNEQTLGGWDYDNFVDACQQDASSAAPDPVLHETTVAEWVALFDHCGNHAVE